MKSLLVSGLAAVCVAAAPAAAAPHLSLQGVATGHHPFALFDLDDATYLLGVGDTIDGRTIRSIGPRGVRLSDGSTLRVSNAPVSSDRGRTVDRVVEQTPPLRRAAQAAPINVNLTVTVPQMIDGSDYDGVPYGAGLAPYGGYPYANAYAGYPYGFGPYGRRFTPVSFGDAPNVFAAGTPALRFGPPPYNAAPSTNASFGPPPAFGGSNGSFGAEAPAPYTFAPRSSGR